MYVMIGLQALNLIAVIVLCVKYVQLREAKENEFYTDYTKGKLILRVFKDEAEYQAIADLPKGWQILDTGRLSQFYRWALIQK